MRPAPETRARRRRMIATQIANRGVRNRRVLAALAGTPREWFVPPSLAANAYEDAPLPIGNGQTISQPYVVALMTAGLAPRRGRLVIPLGDLSTQELVIVTRGRDGWTERRAGGVRFVPLVSSLAFTEPVEP